MIDSIFAGITYEESNALYGVDFGDVFRFSKSFTRYKQDSLSSKYRPYELNSDSYLRLNERVKIVDAVEKQLSLKSVVNFEDGRLLLKEPSLLDSLMMKTDLTPEGLLALRLRKSYGSSEFKIFITKTFLDINFRKVRVGRKNILIWNGVSLQEQKVLLEFLLQLKNPIDYSNFILNYKYTFQWRD